MTTNNICYNINVNNLHKRGDHIIRFVLLSFIIGLAVWCDFKDYKVNNYLIVLGMAGGCCYQVVSHGSSGIGEFLIGFTVPIVVLFVLFLLRMLGAGDIKLFAVIGGFYGVTLGIRCIVYSFLIGAILSLLYLLKHQSFLTRFQYFFNYVSRCITCKQVQPYRSEEVIAENSGIIHFTLAIAMAYYVLLLIH